MKIIALIVCVVLILIAYAMVSGKSRNLLTEEEAKQIVRVFEGDPNLELKGQGLESDTLNPFYPKDKPYYSYDLDSLEKPDPKGSWEVDARSGTVVSVSYWDRFPEKERDKPSGSYTKPQCQKTAAEYARATYAGFDKAGFRLQAARWGGDGWEFGWQQIVEYGAFSPNFIKIAVSATSGRIQSYSSTYYPVLRPKRPPEIGKDKAVTIAAKASSIAKLDSYDQPSLHVDYSTLYWLMRVVGKSAKGRWIDALVEVDAYSGSVREAVLAPIPRR